VGEPDGVKEWGEGAGDKDEVDTNSPEVANDTGASMCHRVGKPRAGSGVVGTFTVCAVSGARQWT